LRTSIVVLASPALLLALPAVAQPVSQAPARATPPAQAGKPAEGKTVGEVVVSGAAPDVRTSIDRTSYNVSKDLQSATGSIGDALRNVPSVEVDVQGNVSLRGDPNVTIMIDGKPSGMFKGEGRAAALQSLPADQIERVEVITNPSAAFNPEGGAGVINLITKKTRKPGYSGSLRGNYGTEGRWNTGVSGGYNSPRLTLSGDLSYRQDPQKFWSYGEREVVDETTGAILRSLDDSQSRGDGEILNARGSLDYDLNGATRLSLEARHIDMQVENRIYQHYEVEDAAGALVRVFDRLGDNAFHRENSEVSGTVRRKFAGEDHELVGNLSFERTDLGGGRDLRIASPVPPRPDSYEVADFANVFDQTELKVDYTRPMPGEGKLKAGYLLQVDANEYDNYGARGPARDQLTVDPALTQLYTYDQTVNAGYVTYEQPFGDLTVLAGLRLEQVAVEIEDVTQGQRGDNDYTKAYPSLHLAWKLSDEQRLTASYSRRVQRPSPQDLNPFRIYVDEFNYRQGNPNLDPQITDSFEAAWQRRAGGAFLLATAYYRQSRDGVTEVVRDLGGGVLLTTRENLGESRAAGLELTANGRLTPKLTYSVNGNLAWTEIDAGRLGFAGNRDGTSVGGRATLNWQVTARDFVQLNGFVQGERLTPQGYRKASGLLNLGYRRKVDDQLSFVVTVQDVLDTFKDVVVIDTPLLRDRVERGGNVQGVFLGFTWTFGGQGQRPREPAFDFGGGGGPPG
jgi:outer membrane receptor protein involved in Fe transport